MPSAADAIDREIGPAEISPMTTQRRRIKLVQVIIVTASFLVGVLILKFVTSPGAGQPGPEVGSIPSGNVGDGGDRRTNEFKLAPGADPTNDCESAFAAGDFHFVGVYGYSLELPGIPEGFANLIRLEKRYKVVAGTSDNWRNGSDAAFNRTAQSYAEDYNKLLIELDRNRQVRPNGVAK